MRLQSLRTRTDVWLSALKIIADFNLKKNDGKTGVSYNKKVCLRTQSKNPKKYTLAYTKQISVHTHIKSA